MSPDYDSCARLVNDQLTAYPQAPRTHFIYIFQLVSFACGIISTGAQKTEQNRIRLACRLTHSELQPARVNLPDFKTRLSLLKAIMNLPTQGEKHARHVV
jgi:hypothetical protein